MTETEYQIYPPGYAMFLDDERMPVEKNFLSEAWVIVRSVEQAKAVIAERGFPWMISFDHDLGPGQPTGMDLAKWLVEQDMDKHWMDREAFVWDIHSQNPVGARNINELLRGYQKHRRIAMKVEDLSDADLEALSNTSMRETHS